MQSRSGGAGGGNKASIHTQPRPSMWCCVRWSRVRRVNRAPHSHLWTSSARGGVRLGLHAPSFRPRASSAESMSTVTSQIKWPTSHVMNSPLWMTTPQAALESATSRMKAERCSDCDAAVSGADLSARAAALCLNSSLSFRRSVQVSTRCVMSFPSSPFMSRGGRILLPRERLGR